MNKLLEELEQLKQSEKKLEDELHKTDIFQKLEETKKRKAELKMKTRDLCIVELREFNNAMCKVLLSYENTNYEGKTYCHSYPDHNVHSLAFYPQDKNSPSYLCINYGYEISDVNIMVGYYNSITIELLRHYKNECQNYVDKFINYICDARCNGDNESLDALADKFLDKTKEDQQKRHEEIEKIKEEVKNRELRYQFEKSCKVDCKTIFNILTYIINKYDTDFEIRQKTHVEEEKNYAYATHQLTIKNKIRENSAEFKTVIDDSFIEEDDYQRYSLNFNLDTEICFYDLKRKLPIIEQTIYAKSFMEMIEDKFERGEKVTKDDCHNFLIEVSNQKKEKQKTKRKDS